MIQSLPSHQGAMIPRALWQKNQHTEQKQHFTKFNKDFKNGPHQKNLWEEKKKECGALLMITGGLLTALSSERENQRIKEAKKSISDSYTLTDLCFAEVTGTWK